MPKPKSKQPATLDLPMKLFKTPAAWEKWLEANHIKSAGIWMQIAKKGTGVTTCVAAEALDVCLCFGWIDGQRKALDDTYFLQKYTPRRPTPNALFFTHAISCRACPPANSIIINAESASFS